MKESLTKMMDNEINAEEDELILPSFKYVNLPALNVHTKYAIETFQHLKSQNSNMKGTHSSFTDKTSTTYNTLDQIFPLQLQFQKASDKFCSSIYTESVNFKTNINGIQTQSIQNLPEMQDDIQPLIEIESSLRSRGKLSGRLSNVKNISEDFSDNMAFIDSSYQSSVFDQSSQSRGRKIGISILKKQSSSHENTQYSQTSKKKMVRFSIEEKRNNGIYRQLLRNSMFDY